MRGRAQKSALCQLIQSVGRFGRAQAQQKQHVVMLGVNERLNLFLHGLNDFAAPGTTFSVVSHFEPFKDINASEFPNLKLEHIYGSPLDPTVLRVRPYHLSLDTPEGCSHPLKDA